MTRRTSPEESREAEGRPRAARRAVLTGGAVGLAAVAGSTLGRVQPASAQASTPSITDWINVVTAEGADNTGATDATAAINDALTAAATKTTPPDDSNPNGSAVVYLPVGTYMTTGPLNIPKGVTLRGATPTNHSGDGQTQDFGSVIKPAGTWSTTEPVAGVITLNASSGPLARSAIESLWIDGSTLPVPGTGTPPAPPVDGIAGYGTVEALTIRCVGVYSVTGTGIAGYSNGSAGPDGWLIENSVIQSCGGTAVVSGGNTTGSGYGVNFTGNDSHMNNVHAQASNNDGFLITAGNNRLVGCRADQSLQGNGFTIDVRMGGGFSGSTSLIGCGTEQNCQNGLNVTNSAPSGNTISDPVIASGCSFDGDGANFSAPGTPQGGGNFAGISVAGKNIVILNGCNVNVYTPKPPTTSGWPQYAMSISSIGSAPGFPMLVQAIGGFWNCEGTTLINGFTGVAKAQNFLLNGFAGGQIAGSDSITLVQSTSPS